ncbi:hypothetical protein EWM64_g7532 [Hericium alpestre]|uniref:Uncharacterized protein n=1 Tax=Hericium alpestre TaxID=135208 RepID=A0A4Y9ZQZ0_9AGAM|nr:hypothetical protein EWM64_g7532 [Hericium alpestre]
MAAEPLPLSFVGFNMPESAESSSENRYDGDNYRSMLATTRERTGLQVGGIDQDLRIPPPANLDIEVGQNGEHASGVDSSRLGSFFSDAALNFMAQPQVDYDGLAGSAFSQPVDWSASTDSNSESFFGASMGQASTSDCYADMMQYGESSTSFEEHARTPSLAAPLSMSNALNVDFNGTTYASSYTQETTTFASYAPPV